MSNYESNYYTELHPCPQDCGGASPSHWTVYSSYSRLQRCNETLLFDFSLYNTISDSSTPSKLRVCTAGDADPAATAPRVLEGAIASTNKHNTKQSMPACDTVTNPKEGPATLEFTRSGTHLGLHTISAVTTALGKLQAWLDNGHDSCRTERTMYVHHQGAVAGIRLGSSFGSATISSVFQRMLEQLSASSISTTMTVQLCGNGRNADHVLGLAVSANGNITALQSIVRDWNEAKCVSDFEFKVELGAVAVWEEVEQGRRLPDAPFVKNGTVLSVITRRTEQLATCRTEKVISGDGCAALAQRCGISGADFTKFNPSSTLCSSLAPGQIVCCSSGELPDIRPKPNDDGTCASHLVKSGDSCSALAAANGMSVSDIDKFNNGTTWGWYGCNKLLADMYICLSKGKPPMPFPIPNAVCGPTKPGSKAPTGKENLKDLNPCPLNACCNVWGQCGISGDFCTEKKSASGNPGTSGLQNGCVSNCGMEIRNRDSRPSSFGRIGYYESWNFQRKCLRQHAENANTDGSYTIIHWAFAEVNTADWSVSIRDEYNQWQKFKKITAKKVISFGGWGYSTLPATYDILRQAMSPAHRETFAGNIAGFLKKEGLDGVDFDWEYPGAIDIPGTPPGFASDTADYLKFLNTMKSKLGTGQTMSIAAPASFWYLKAFPIKLMAAVLDYIVYMTYDLHVGQWDAGNQYSIEGCPAGNCLRSHVNLTETATVLAMITKAGVATNKIYVGESSYGRSFKMAKAGCTGPTCTFLGDRLNSKAKKGRCTDTQGYISNAEISEIIASIDPDPDSDAGTISGKAWHDKESNSDILVYEETEWVAYMSKVTKETRRKHWMGFNFAGTIDWAVDLQSFTIDDFKDPKTGEFPDDPDKQLPPVPSACKGSYDTLEKIRDDKSIPSHCALIYMTEVLANTLKNSMATYDRIISEGYDKKFNTYADAVVKGGKKAVRDWMYKNGNTYFTCDVVEPIECCDWCYDYYNVNEEGQCKYCDKKYCHGWSSICNQPEVNCDGLETGWFNMTGPCPPDFSKRAGPEPTDGYGQSIYWHLRRDKENDFWADLYKGVGIKQEDIKFENVERYHSCTPATPDQCKYFGWDFGIAVPHGYDKTDVLNPKSVVDSAYKNLKDIIKDLPTAITKLKAGTYDGSGADLVDAIALPVFMIEEAVNNIKTIADTIDEMEEEKRKNIILAFLSAILFFVPVIGEIASSIAALATIGRVIAILGTAGQVALDIYSVVDSKGNDPLDIFGLVLAPLAIFDVVRIGKAAARARGMTDNDIGKLGKNIQGKMDLVRKTNSACKLSKRNVFPMGALPMTGLNGDPVWSQDFN
ncbi:killer toxin alpha/beta [Lasiosphaeria hispida]|uniref:chitinase n=1 Tax=Lasiosphaeria hispida TaxID=260671 RepID=A0AAJ0MIU7_9PEZI|nr:killer toxin alpha/beta [Lasiosphaeria hispida]